MLVPYSGEKNVSKLLPQLTSTRKVQTGAMKKGLAREPEAASMYSKIYMMIQITFAHVHVVL